MTKNNVKMSVFLGITGINVVAWIVSAIVAGIVNDYRALVPIMWVSVVSVLGIVEVWRIK